MSMYARKIDSQKKRERERERERTRERERAREKQTRLAAEHVTDPFSPPTLRSVQPQQLSTRAEPGRTSKAEAGSRASRRGDCAHKMATASRFERGTPTVYFSIRKFFLFPPGRKTNSHDYATAAGNRPPQKRALRRFVTIRGELNFLRETSAPMSRARALADVVGPFSVARVHF